MDGGGDGFNAISDGLETFVESHEGLIDDAGRGGEIIRGLRFVSEFLDFEDTGLDVGDAIGEFCDVRRDGEQLEVAVGGGGGGVR